MAADRESRRRPAVPAPALLLLLLLLLALVAAPGCNAPHEPAPPAATTTPSTYAEGAASLRDCPTDDRLWAATYDLARAEKKQAELERLAEELSPTCAGRWEPPWIRGKCVRDRPEQARELFETAYGIADGLNDDAGRARTANDAGWMAYLAGELTRGRTWYERGLEATARSGRADHEAYLRNNLAGLLVRAGDFAAARTELEIAESKLIVIGKAPTARRVQRNRAILLLELGDAHGARDVLLDLHGWARETGDRTMLDLCAVVLGNLHLALGRIPEAREWYGAVSENAQGLAGFAELGLGRAALAEGHDAEAARILSRGAELSRPTDVGRALILEAYAAGAGSRARREPASRKALETIVDEADALGTGESRWLARSLLGEHLLATGDVGAATATLRRSIELLERQSAALDPAGEGLHFLRERTEPYVTLALALARGGDDAAAEILDVAGRVHARALGAQPSATTGSTAGARLRAIEMGLQHDELLIVYLLGRDAGIAVAVGPDGTTTAAIPGRRDLVTSVVAYRDALAVPRDTAGNEKRGLTEDDLRHGNRIFDALIAPLAHRVFQAKRIWVVPDREIALLPLAALPVPNGETTFLGDALEIARLPRAGVPPSWDAERAPVLLAGLPDLAPGSAFGELPWAAYELSRLRELWPDDASTLVSGDGFSADGLGNLGLDRFRTLHLATHAVASTRDPRRCGILLSGGEMLGLESIAALKLNDGLVVLSACRTGEGELLPGQGVIGLGWAFLQAGARAIVASQWTVDDVASAKLMVAFHRRLREGTDPVRALTLARRELAAEVAHPAYWAPFVLLARPR